ncbi:MAG TPA: protein-glutamate O-methyltransferase CheR [Candidatus Eisenbacteria bacterium]|nr:protein-glutamate O-methyltransferase CheR [Candidatus Eisenbacteria bacterium]
MSDRIPDAPASAQAPAVGAGSYAYLQRLLLQRTGIVLEPGKEYLVEARLHAVAQHEGCASVAALLEALETEEIPGPLHRRVVEAMLNGETSFFRDHYPFEALRTTLLPELMERRASTRTLHFWSAATSSGQEAYSLAMLLLDAAPALHDWTVRILATDVSDAMLERARAGVYRQIEVNRGLPAACLVQHFERRGQDWKVKDRVRAMVEFSHLNLAGPWPSLPLFDVILLRNVLLYFSSDARRTILLGVTRQLRPDGYLFLGGGETILSLDRSFETARAGKAVCYRVRADRGASPRGAGEGTG